MGCHVSLGEASALELEGEERVRAGGPEGRVGYDFVGLV